MDVSVVIVSYNAASYLKECIDSILALTKNPNIEIIVVDNNSTDDSVKVATQFKNQNSKVKIIENKENKGYGAGVNIGLKTCLPAGRYILVLNPDIRFLDDAISKMTAFMEANKEVGLAGCTLLDSPPAGEAGEEKMLSNGGYFPTLTRLLLWAYFIKLANGYHPPTGIYNQDFYPDWVTGGFMFLRNEVIKKVGLLDENIFMYGEEVEWQYRMRLAGYKIGYTTTTKVIHHERGSQGGLPKGAILGEFKGIRYIYGKYFAGWKQVLVGTILDVAAANRVLMWLIRLKPQMARIYLEALIL